MGAGAQAADEISLEKQWEIIQAYLLVTGQADKFESLPLAAQVEETGLPIKCGTPAVTQFILNRDKFDQELIQSLGELADRPTNLNQTVYSPSNRFLIHYTTQGTDAIPNTPGYADSVARIFDEVYFKLVDTLGYPDPPTDEFYPTGGDEAFDVYLLDLQLAYGLTYPDVAISNQEATSFMELENDYAGFSEYEDRPLDAVRVTAAHEFFHVVQLGIDYTEGTESPDGQFRSYWMEMSATWAEEEVYDDINDYYFYLPAFFVAPFASIQRFDSGVDTHPYASMLYPLFLSEKYDRDLIRDIWLRCRDLGPFQDHFLTAANDVIDTYTSGAESFASTFHEFTMWNYFAGSLRAVLVPDGIGYEEGINYPAFQDHGQDSVIAVYRDYDTLISVEGADNNLSPQHNAAFYLQLEQIGSIAPDTTYWICNDASGQVCNDSSQVFDTTQGYDFAHIDSSFAVGFDLDADFTRQWGLNIIYMLQDYPDSAETEEMTLPAGFSNFIEFYYNDYSRFRSIAFALTPASSDRTFYLPGLAYDVGYEVSVEQMALNPGQTNLPAAVLAPYPNPAVVSTLDRGVVTFRFQVPTDSEGIPLYGERFSGSSPSLYVDIYSVAGELVRTLDQITDASAEFIGVYETEWDLKNANGKDVASGVYVAYARLFGDSNHRQILAEEKTKVLIIR